MVDPYLSTPPGRLALLFERYRSAGQASHEQIWASVFGVPVQEIAEPLALAGEQLALTIRLVRELPDAGDDVDDVHLTHLPEWGDVLFGIKSPGKNNPIPHPINQLPQAAIAQLKQISQLLRSTQRADPVFDADVDLSEISIQLSDVVNMINTSADLPAGIRHDLLSALGKIRSSLSFPEIVGARPLIEAAPVILQQGTLVRTAAQYDKQNGTNSSKWNKAVEIIEKTEDLIVRLSKCFALGFAIYGMAVDAPHEQVATSVGVAWASHKMITERRQPLEIASGADPESDEGSPSGGLPD